MGDLKRQLQYTRESVLKEIEGINPELFDIQPQGFNNTIHWHIGHVLNASELFLFGHPEAGELPAHYAKLFGYGSKPADWNEDVPSVEVLTKQLQDQLTRILEIPEERFNDLLSKPFKDFKTVGEITSFTTFHETYHLGQIHAMKLVLNAAN